MQQFDVISDYPILREGWSASLPHCPWHRLWCCGTVWPDRDLWRRSTWQVNVWNTATMIAFTQLGWTKAPHATHHNDMKHCKARRWIHLKPEKKSMSKSRETIPCHRSYNKVSTRLVQEGEIWTACGSEPGAYSPPITSSCMNLRLKIESRRLQDADSSGDCKVSSHSDGRAVDTASTSSHHDIASSSYQLPDTSASEWIPWGSGHWQHRGSNNSAQKL